MLIQLQLNRYEAKSARMATLSTLGEGSEGGGGGELWVRMAICGLIDDEVK